MAIRFFGMTLGGKLSVAYLAISSFLFIAGGHSSELFLTIFGFPLLYAPWLYSLIFGEIGQLNPTASVLLFVLLWVPNAYLWGHAAALAVWWFSTWFRITPEAEPGKPSAK
jgi:hypothetical protein